MDLDTLTSERDKRMRWRSNQRRADTHVTLVEPYVNDGEPRQVGIAYGRPKPDSNSYAFTFVPTAGSSGSVGLVWGEDAYAA